MSGDIDGMIFVGKAEQPEYLTLKLANRHGLVTGATGTGKTVTLQSMAEGFSARRRAGVRRRHQGRPLRRLHARRRPGLDPEALRARSASNTSPTNSR